VESGQPVDTLLGHGAAVYGVSFQPQGSLVATCAFDLKTIVWDTRTSKKNGSIVAVLQGHLDDIIGIDFDSSGTLLATGSDDKTCSTCYIEMSRIVGCPKMATTEGFNCTQR
jgi:WD40 repeat protein